ncbi:MAG: DUF2066 domain-containing protein [Hyphomicrobium sp.]|nr:DUF2066 domain-containing protein [Hyphomicrobium sp.]PPC83540.1 MAG: hypothetical protein CTY40_02050 [Hyphomicrobium sp.]
MTIVFEAKSMLARAAALAAMVLTQSGAALAVPASDKAFTVANYPVEARAQDAVTAKDRAMTDGQQAAFRSLLKRIVPVTAYDSLKRLKSIKAADLIDGVSIRSERNSSTEYLASLDFTFQPDGVRTILRREGVPFIDTQAPEALLIPVVREGAGAAGAAVTWTEAWQNLDVVHTLTPLKLEKLKPEIHSDTLRSLTDGTGAAERILNGEYKAGLIVAAVADIDVPGKRLHVTLAGRDAVGPINWKRSYRLASGEQAYALELAAVVGLGVLEGRWKAVQAARAAASRRSPGRVLRCNFWSSSQASGSGTRSAASCSKPRASKRSALIVFLRAVRTCRYATPAGRRGLPMPWPPEAWRFATKAEPGFSALGSSFIV